MRAVLLALSLFCGGGGANNFFRSGKAGSKLRLRRPVHQTAHTENLVDQAVAMRPDLMSKITVPAITANTCQVDSPNSVAIFIRMYEGHRLGLYLMLRSLANQQYPHWCAFVFNTDIKPNPDLHLIFAELNDTRFVQLNDIASKKFDYWDAGYHLSDQAISAVANAYVETPFKWLLVTNGDNHYEPEFLTELDPTFDAISFDFFSRWDPFALQQSRVLNRCFLNMQRTGETGAYSD
jgi:hypothetical protein